MPDTPGVNDAGPTSTSPEQNNLGTVLTDQLPAREQFSPLDKITIISFSIVFALIFIVLLVRGDRLFAYWSFMAILTLVFVGILGAVGIIRTRWIALGGSAAVYIGLLWWTGSQFDKYQDSTGTISTLQSKVVALESEKTALRSEFDTEKGTLQRQIASLQKDLDSYRDQDLAIATFDARHSRPIRLIKFRYVLRSGDEKIAEKRENRHFIPVKELRDVMAIAIEFDLIDARPERPGATDVTQNIDIERMNLRTQPLQIDLFIRLKEEA